ncbi:MAG TPA: membrane protein insertase YidC [Bacteroidales bacterium]|nr:membrane protein insertase YidC [Bacteroidales bacterium]
MNKGTVNTIIGLLLIFGILIGYSLLTAPSKEERLAKFKKDSAAWAQKNLQIHQDSIAKGKSDSINKIKQDSLSMTQPDDTVKGTISDTINELNKKFGKFSVSAKGTKKHFILEDSLVKIKLSSLGGGISSVELKTYKTHDGKPLILFDTDTSNFSLTFLSGYKDINTSGLSFEPYCTDKRFSGKDSIVISGSDSVSFALRLHPNGSDSAKNTGKYIEFLYTLRADNYMMGFDINIVNMQDVIDENSTYLAFDWKLDLTQQEKSLKNELMNTNIYFKPAEDKVDYLKENSDDKKDKLHNIKWVSFKQQFFSSTLLSDASFKEASLEIVQQKDTLFPGYLKTLSASITFPYDKGPEQSYPMSMYFGPTKYKILNSYDLGLERQIPLGWGFFLLHWINRLAVIPVFNWLESYGINYGIIILILTILLKIVLLPIAYKTYMSSARMRVLKPEVDEIGQKFPKKEDAMKKQQATMALYKKAGINPMSGCVPMLLQMPILIALYRFFPASIELRQQPFLWANDLSSYDSVWDFPGGFSIPFYGDHVSLFCLLMTISTILYTKLNNQMMGTQSQPGMKFIMYAMPVMFLGFFNDFASGLSYYYLLANLITFLQMFLFRKFVNEDKIHARIQEHKKKPVKVSGFQKRLENMAKRQGYPVKKK